MSQTIAKVAAYLNVPPAQIVEVRAEDNLLVVLVDYGIGGIKKFRLSPAVLPKDPEPEETENLVEKATRAVARAKRGRKKEGK